jgi:hypothetical protein
MWMDAVYDYLKLRLRLWKLCAAKQQTKQLKIMYD